MDHSMLPTTIGHRQKDRPLLTKTDTISHLIAFQVQTQPDAAAIVGLNGNVLTYLQVQNCLSRIGSAIRGIGVSREDRVAVVAPNGPAMAIAFLGVASEAVCAPLNPAYTLNEFDFYLSDL